MGDIARGAIGGAIKGATSDIAESVARGGTSDSASDIAGGAAGGREKAGKVVEKKERGVVGRIENRAIKRGGNCLL